MLHIAQYLTIIKEKDRQRGVFSALKSVFCAILACTQPPLLPSFYVMKASTDGILTFCKANETFCLRFSFAFSKKSKGHE